MKTRIRILAALVVLAFTPAAAQSAQLAAAIAAGQVGERYDGYMGFANTPTPGIRRQVEGINIQRRNLYADLGTRRNVTGSVVGLTTGCALLAQIAVGEAYMLKDGVWRRRAANEPAPVPDYCH